MPSGEITPSSRAAFSMFYGAYRDGNRHAFKFVRESVRRANDRGVCGTANIDIKSIPEGGQIFDAASTFVINADSDELLMSVMGDVNMALERINHQLRSDNSGGGPRAYKAGGGGGRISAYEAGGGGGIPSAYEAGGGGGIPSAYEAGGGGGIHRAYVPPHRASSFVPLLEAESHLPQQRIDLSPSPARAPAPRPTLLREQPALQSAMQASVRSEFLLAHSAQSVASAGSFASDEDRRPALSSKRKLLIDALRASSDYVVACQSMLIQALEDPAMTEADLLPIRQSMLESVNSMAAILRRDTSVVLLMPPRPAVASQHNPEEN